MDMFTSYGHTNKPNKLEFALAISIFKLEFALAFQL